MYPWRRLALVLLRARSRGPLAVDGLSEIGFTCMPWDIDLYGELNNGRTLTLCDLGRIDQCLRSGFVRTMRRERWAVTLGGASIRWRRRVRAFDRLTLRTRPFCRDERWVYFHQALYRGGEAVSAVLARACAVRDRRLVPTDEVAAALGVDWNPPVPEWVAAWARADGERPWPPEFASEERKTT